MPLNTLRLNHPPSSHPNERIVFIKPLPRPAHRQHEYDMADTFLRAIAAQCQPIMKSHWLSVTTLEEFEPNSEFMGRNFNAVVQMVMMHELAHNVHMNHAKAFWNTRDVFAAELKALWARGYTGDGFWSDGRMLGDLTSLMHGGDGTGIVRSAELAGLPLCGGTYRTRRGGKRKRKKADDLNGSRPAPAVTWKERKERRIEKKFGKNGVSLGEDEEARMILELRRKGGGNSGGSKPRVAGSKRGRELRAAAALQRFEVAKARDQQQKQEAAEEEETIKEEDQDENGAGDDDGYDDEDDTGDETLDINGKQLQDKDGRAMSRVCEVGNSGDVNVKQELEELEGLDRYYSMIGTKKTETKPAIVKTSDDDDDDDNQDIKQVQKSKSRPKTPPQAADAVASGSSIQVTSTVAAAAAATITDTTVSCPICSLDNPSAVSTCSACSHVLDTSKDPRHWKCLSAACLGSGTGTGTNYINGGDAGLCGLCGERRP